MDSSNAAKNGVAIESPDDAHPAVDAWDDCRLEFLGACRAQAFPTVDEIRKWVAPFPRSEQSDLAVDLAVVHLRSSWERKRGLFLEEYVHVLGEHFDEFRTLESLPIYLIETEFLARHENAAPADLPSLASFQTRFGTREDVQECIQAKSLDRGRYVLTRFIGAGGLGRVWKAYDRHLCRAVAIKAPQSGPAWGSGTRDAFEHEGRITAGLEHPSILTVHEIAQSDEKTPYSVMRLVVGRTLEAMIGEFHLAPAKSDPRRTSLLWNELLRHFMTVCNAIAYAHEREVIHRDLKPQNVMVGRFGEAVVVDWGLARSLVNQTETGPTGMDDRPSVPTSGETSLREGTHAYMSPEQAGGETSLPPSDIFGLGAILYSILTGRAPYIQGANEDHAGYLARIKAVRFPKPRSVNASAPRSLEAVCLKAMSPRSDARYASASLLAEDVARFLADEPVSAYAEPPHVRVFRWVKRHRTPVAAVFVAAVVAVPLLIGGYAQEMKARGVAQERGRLALVTVDKTRKVLIEDEIMRQPTLAAPREKLLAIQTEFYEQLRAQLDADRGAGADDREQLADASESHASVLAATGAKDRAIALYQEALAIRQALPAFPAQRQRDLARLHAELGLLLSEVGPARQAVDALTESIRIRTKLLDQQPADAELRRELARSWADLGIQRRDHGQQAEAESAFEKACGLLEPDPGRPPDDPALRTELGRSLLNRAMLRAEFGRTAKGLADACRARDLARDLVRSNPRDHRARSLLGRALDRVGVLQLETGLLDEATASVQEALEIRRGLVHDQPLFADFRDDLAATLGNISNIQTARHQEKAARESLDEAGRILVELTERYGSVVRYQDDFASYFHSVAGRHFRNGDLPHALEALAKARTIREALLRKDANLAPVRMQLARTLYNEGKLRDQHLLKEEASGRLRGSSSNRPVPAELTTALDLLSSMLSEAPDDLKASSLLGEVRDLIACVGLESGRDLHVSDHLKAAAAGHRAAFAAAPMLKHFRQALVDHDEVVLTVAQLIFDRDASVSKIAVDAREAWLCQGNELVSIAGEMARCAALESASTDGAGSGDGPFRKRCVAQAILALDLALRAGVRHETLEHSPDLDPLRGDAEFQKWLQK